MDLAGRVALVTGGGHRVGRAIALGLARAGADVAVNYRTSAAAAAQTVTDLHALGVRAGAFAADVSHCDEVDSMVREIESTLGPVDVLVNSASVFRTDRFPSDHGVWHATLDVLVDGAYHCASAVAPGMVERGCGTIISVVDLSAWQPWPGRLAHSVAKAALLALSRQLAVELAPAVRSNAVALGPTMPGAGFDSEQIERLRRRTLLGHWVGVDEAAKAVRYLAEADSVTGECLTVDAGEQYGHVRERFVDELARTMS